MTTSSFLTVDMPCDIALQAMKKKLLKSGLQVLQTFDLHTARHAHLDCSCPNHSTVDCDCQMVVLMVYGETPDPAVLILHGSGRQTRLSVADDPSQRVDEKLIMVLKKLLVAVALN